MSADLLVDALAVYRLSRLVSADLITFEVREQIIRELYAARGDRDARTIAPAMDREWTRRALEDGPEAPKLAQLIVCRWCTSMWLGAGVLAARRLAPRAWRPASYVLAWSAVAGLAGIVEHFAEPQQIELEGAEPA